MYDPYGGVLTSTLSAALTTALAEQGATADPATGLVYQGNGRFYDPVLGRPLQPNPSGGVPILPQSLSRYGATALGAPGVAEGVDNGGHIISQLLPYGSEVGTAWLDDTYSPNVGQALAHLLPRSYSSSIDLGAVFITLTMLKTEVRNLAFGQALSRLNGYIHTKEFPWYNRASSYTWVDVRIPVEGDLAAEARVVAGQLARFGRVDNVRIRLLGSRPILDAVNPGTVQASAKLSGVGLDVLVNAGFQYWEDAGNPYLTGGQKLGRAIISGGGGAGFAFLVVEGLAVAGCSATLACAIVGGIVGSVIWAAVQPHIFEDVIPGLDERPRNLRALP